MQGAIVFSRSCRARMLGEGWEEVETIWNDPSSGRRAEDLSSILVKYDSPEEKELYERLRRACLVSRSSYI